MTSDTVFVVVYDTRTPVGVGQLVDTLWTDEAQAAERVALINTDHRQFPGMVAWTEEYRLSDGGRLVPYQDGRSHQGDENPMSRLTVGTVREAREQFRGGATIEYLARYYGVSRQSMSSAVYGRTWANVA